MISKDFVVAGSAVFTVEPAEAFIAAQAQLGNEWHPHYTYRVEKVEFEKLGEPKRTCYFVKALTGPDNTGDYTYLGMLNLQTGGVQMTAKSAFPETATRVRIVRRVLAALWRGEAANVEATGWKVHHEGKCGRCGRALTVPASVESGIGPECAKKMACTAA